MTIADSGMGMGHLPVAEEAPLKDSLLSADRVSQHKNLSKYQKFLSVSIIAYRVFNCAID